MFNLGPIEIMIVFGLALIVLGPRKLPELAHHAGKFYGMIRRTTWELRQTLDSEILAEERKERRDEAEKRRERFRSERAATRAAEGPPSSADKPQPQVAPAATDSAAAADAVAPEPAAAPAVKEPPPAVSDEGSAGGSGGEPT